MATVNMVRLIGKLRFPEVRDGSNLIYDSRFPPAGGVYVPAVHSSLVTHAWLALHGGGPSTAAMHTQTGRTNKSTTSDAILLHGGVNGRPKPMNKPWLALLAAPGRSIRTVSEGHPLDPCATDELCPHKVGGGASPPLSAKSDVGTARFIPGRLRELCCRGPGWSRGAVCEIQRV